MTNRKVDLSFEKSLEELECIIKSMDSNDLVLDELIKDYEKGSSLIQRCEELLSTAQRQLEQVEIKGGEKANEINKQESKSDELF